jgi:hypothetical protein
VCVRSEVSRKYRISTAEVFSAQERMGTQSHIPVEIVPVEHQALPGATEPAVRYKILTANVCEGRRMRSRGGLAKGPTLHDQSSKLDRVGREKERYTNEHTPYNC